MPHVYNARTRSPLQPIGAIADGESDEFGFIGHRWKRPKTPPIRSRRRNAPRPMSGLGHTAYHHTGAISTDTGKLIGTAAVIAGAWHGYRRTGKARWAVVYALLASLSPLITGAVMVAQGFGKRKAGG